MEEKRDVERFHKSRVKVAPDASGRVRRRIHISAHHPRATESTAEDARIIAIAGKYAAMSTVRVYSLIKAAQYVNKNNIPGPAVVCGVGNGGSALALARAFRNAGETDREIWLYDTFDSERRHAQDDYTAPISYVKAILAKRCPQYRQESFKFIKGMVEDTIPATIPPSISVLHCDTDWYESTKHELIHLYPLLSFGGVLLVDDYGVWEGARRATDEYFEETCEPMLLNVIDHTGRIGVKTTGAEK